MPRRGDGLVDFSRRLVWPLGALTLLIMLFRLSPLPLKHVFIILFTAILLAAAVSPAARFMSRFGVPRGLTILCVYLLMFASVLGAMALIVPLVVTQVDALRAALPAYVADLQQELARVAPQQAQHFSSTTLVNEVSTRLSGFVGQLTSIVFTSISIGIDIVLILVMAFFMAYEESFARSLVTRYVPPQQRPRVARMMGRIGTRMGNWARAQLLLAVFFGTAFGLGLRVIGIPYWLTLGVIGGILEIIPYVGGFTALILGVLLALTRDPLHAAFVAGWYTIVVELEAHVLAPKLMDRFLGIHPVVVVIALFLGGESLGILGALLAVPIAIVFQVLLDEFYSFGGPDTSRSLPGFPSVKTDPAETVPAPEPRPSAGVR